MGESKQKSRRRDQILAGELRCIYCMNPPSTVEHMPPKAIFPRRHRFSGMEYASYETCNHNSRAADTAAAIMARISKSTFIDALILQEARRLRATRHSLSSQFIHEQLDPRKVMPSWE